MVVLSKNKEKITVSFSGDVGKEGLTHIKSYIEFLERNKRYKKKKVSQKIINKLADEVTEAAWQKLKQKKGL